MNEKDIKVLEETRDALTQLVLAWEKLSDTWGKTTVQYLTNDRGDEIYPFTKSFDEMLEDVKEWAWYYSDEIDYELARDKAFKYFEDMAVRPSIIARIAESIYEEYGNLEG